MRKISEQECLKNLIGGIDCISKYHRHNKVWCCNQSNWNEKEYGWTNPLFPPEYQKACLNGTEFVPESTCDLYFFMIQFYIWVTESNPDINFLRNDKWKKKFILYTENYEEQTQKLIMILFSWCTRSSVDKRPEALCHLYFASHRSGVREILYKSQLANIAYNIELIPGYNIIGTSPTTILDFGLPLKILKTFDQSTLIYKLYSETTINICRMVYEQYADYMVIIKFLLRNGIIWKNFVVTMGF